MPIFTSQEKNLTIFLLSVTIIGSLIGIVRHDWPATPEILLSPKNLPSYIKNIEEKNIINTHIKNIHNQLNSNEVQEINLNNNITKDREKVSIESGSKILPNQAINKTKSVKKKITQNTSGIININIASKEDFMKLPYIGEVKAERIIQLRDKTGAFVSTKDLEEVKGIGPKIFNKIEPFITI